MAKRKSMTRTLSPRSGPSKFKFIEDPNQNIGTSKIREIWTDFFRTFDPLSPEISRNKLWVKLPQMKKEFLAKLVSDEGVELVYYKKDKEQNYWLESYGCLKFHDNSLSFKQDKEIFRLNFTQLYHLFKNNKLRNPDDNSRFFMKGTNIIKIDENTSFTIPHQYLWWLWEFLHPIIEKHRLRYIVDIIKELLNELDPGDDVELEHAVNIISQEAQEIDPDPTFIREFLVNIAENVKGFKFVRLKNTIRYIGNESSQVGSFLANIDQLFENWDKSKKKNNLPFY